MLANGLPRFCRLHLKNDFKRVITGGIKLQYNGLVLWSAPNKKGDVVRFAVVVSKKLGPAVLRNRTKRLLREAFRISRIHLVKGTDVIVCPKDSEKINCVQAAQDALMTLCRQAHLCKPDPSANPKDVL